MKNALRFFMPRIYLPLCVSADVFVYVLARFYSTFSGCNTQCSPHEVVSSQSCTSQGVALPACYLFRRTHLPAVSDPYTPIEIFVIFFLIVCNSSYTATTMQGYFLYFVWGRYEKY